MFTCCNYFHHSWKLVGEQSWLACGPGGLGLDTPGLNTGDIDAQPVLHDGSTICVADMPPWSVGLVFSTGLRLASLDLCLIRWSTANNICTPQSIGKNNRNQWSMVAGTTYLPEPNFISYKLHEFHQETWGVGEDAWPQVLGKMQTGRCFRGKRPRPMHYWNCRRNL